MASKMATKNQQKTVETTEDTPEESTPEGPVIDALGATIKKMLSKGKERGYVTYDELNAALPQDQFTSEQITDIARALEGAGVSTIEVSHGDGMGGASYNYGFSKEPEENWLRAAAKVIKNARLAILLIPGIGTQEHLEKAYEIGARVARIATHCTEADISQQHIGLARDLGMETIGFLMLAHMISAEALLEQAKLMESYGAHCVYVVDSAGAMLPDGYRRKVSTLRNGLEIPVGSGSPSWPNTMPKQPGCRTSSP